MDADADAVLRELLEPVLREAVASLAALAAAGDAPDIGDDIRRRQADRLAKAAEAAQEALGQQARDPRVHRIIGAAASAAMALSLGGGVVPDADVIARLGEGLEQMSAGSWPPEDQDPAD